MTSDKQGPWTDIYGLSATLYHAITGRTPPSPQWRRVLNDSYEPLTKLPAGGLFDPARCSGSMPAWRCGPRTGRNRSPPGATVLRRMRSGPTTQRWSTSERAAAPQPAVPVERPAFVPLPGGYRAESASRSMPAALTAAIVSQPVDTCCRCAAGAAIRAVGGRAQGSDADGGAASWLATRPRAKAAADAEAKRQSEAQAKAQAERQRAAAEAEARQKAEAEARQKAAAEAKLKAGGRGQAEGRRRGRLKAEAEAKQRADAEAKRKAEAEAKLEGGRRSQAEGRRRGQAEGGRRGQAGRQREAQQKAAVRGQAGRRKRKPSRRRTPRPS